MYADGIRPRVEKSSRDAFVSCALPFVLRSDLAEVVSFKHDSGIVLGSTSGGRLGLGSLGNYCTVQVYAIAIDDDSMTSQLYFVCALFFFSFPRQQRQICNDI